ncbi:MAG: hypothetical protein IJ899_10585 [Blautia sp.]|nr:hypothetical protein [Blautia sp.]
MQNLTQNAIRLFQKETAGFHSYYCREDVAAAMEDCKNATADEAPSREMILRRMCDAIGGPSGRELLENPDLLSKIPSREELQTSLLDAFHSLYSEVPTASSYMRRIVDNLVPQYHELPVRTAILIKFIAGAGFHCRTFPIDFIEARIKSSKMSPDEILLYNQASDEKKLELLVSKVDDAIFTSDLIPKKLTPEEIVRVRTQVLENLKNKKLTDKNGTAVSLPSDPSLPSGPEDRFRAVLHAIFYPKRTGGREQAFELYKTAKRDALRRKAGNTNAELLTICQDLAEGKFKTTNGRTRALLYYFGIMFDMEVSLDQEKNIPESKDFEKNLFHDFYSDHLFRYLKGSVSDEESEPTGEGINYKNYAEMIYFYYLYNHKALPLPPGELIDRAEEMIQKTYNAAKKQVSTKSNFPAVFPPYTSAYRSDIVTEMVRTPEQKLVDYVVRHFQVIPPSGGNTGRLMVASEEKTAHKMVTQILDELELYQDTSFYDVRDNLFGDHLSEIGKEFLAETRWLTARDSSFAQALKARYEKDTDFVTIIDKLEERCLTAFGWTKTDSSPETVPFRITRNQLVSAYAMLYRASIGEKPALITFPMILADFKKGIDPYLTEARFQPFNEKNLLDLYLLLDLYYYLACYGKEDDESDY